jgi:hypothetical protein
MFVNLEHAIVIAALIWGIVHLLQHFFPSYWERMERFNLNARLELDARVKALEEKLGISEEKK